MQISFGNLHDACFVEWLGELVDDSGTGGESGLLPRRDGKEDLEVAKAPLQYCCYHCYWGAVDEKQDFREEARFSATGVECQHGELVWKGVGGNV